jgi:hypothetical protein
MIRAMSDDGDSKDLWNVGKLLPDYMVLQPRRQQSLKPGSFTSHSPRDVRPCPNAEQSGRQRKCQRAEILTSTSIKKLQREKCIKKGKKECVSLPESKKGASPKFVLLRKQWVSLRWGIFVRCVKIPPLNRPKKTGCNAPGVHCAVMSCVLVTVVVGHTFVTNVLIKCF